MSTSFTCPKCRMTSYNPMDAKHQFCGNCHQFFNIREPAVRDDLSTVTDMTWEEVEVLVDKIGISQDYRDMQITTQKAESFAESLGWFFHPSHPDGRGWHHPAREGHIDPLGPADFLASLAYWEEKTVEDLAEQFTSWLDNQESE